jgi:hypothetical protein
LTDDVADSPLCGTFADPSRQGMAVQRDAYTKFSIDGVLVDTFGVVGRNLAIFIPIALLAQLPAVVFDLLPASAVSSGTGFRISIDYLIDLRTIPDAIEALVALACYSIAQAALASGTIADLNGRPATLTNVLIAARKSTLSVIAITVLSNLGIVVGFVLLIVPGVILAVGWSVAVPACVIERKSIFESFRRSWEMTRGHRLAIFGVLIIAVVGMTILLLIFMSLSGALAVGVGGNSTPAIHWLASLVVNCGVSVFGGSLVGAIYYELYFIKEGHAPGALASVFD